MESVVTGPSNRYSITYGRQTEIAESNLNKIFTTTAASLSLIGALLIIITFIMWPDLRTNSRRMIMFISIGDFSVALFNIIGIYNPSSDNEICRMQSLVTNVAILSSFMWTLNLSFYFYLTICRKISAEYERRIMQLLHLIGWGIPILIGTIAFTMGAYGFSRNVLTSGWCWISENPEMVGSCHVDVRYRKRLGDHVIYLHLQVLFVGHTADQTRGMFKKPRPLIS